MKRLLRVILAAMVLCTCQSIYADDAHEGWWILRWMERPAKNGPSTKAKEEDKTTFTQVLSYDAAKPETFDAFAAKIQEGDLIAYRMAKGEARKQIRKGHLSKVGYRLLKYGHLAIVVTSPGTKKESKLFSSQSFTGPNVDESLSTLKTHSVHVYRLDQWDRVDTDRLHEFVRLSMARAGAWYGYDFSGMFGLWNSNLQPGNDKEIGHDYICSTVVVAALHYSGLELDAVQRGGLIDLVSPKQVVTSKGCIIPLPDIDLEEKLAAAPVD